MRGKSLKPWVKVEAVSNQALMACRAGSAARFMVSPQDHERLFRIRQPAAWRPKA
jgi:hypothetical protein